MTTTPRPGESSAEVLARVYAEHGPIHGPEYDQAGAMKRAAREAAALGIRAPIVDDAPPSEHEAKTLLFPKRRALGWARP